MRNLLTSFGALLVVLLATPASPATSGVSFGVAEEACDLCSSSHTGSCRDEPGFVLCWASCEEGVSGEGWLTCMYASSSQACPQQPPPPPPPDYCDDGES
jgi:hypothetical protein